MTLEPEALELKSQSGFFRVSFENQINMPAPIPKMGLLNLSYFADLSPILYAGFGGYGSVTGTQGGLFTLGFGAGAHYEILPHIWPDASIFIGGGGGKSSLTGGGLMIQPQAGLATLNQIQDQTIDLVGAEFDHYFSDKVFWWLKTSGAFAGIPNGYMDVLSGLGYHAEICNGPFSIIPAIGIGAGGGGLVETGGGFLVNPLLGIEWSILPKYSARISSGYIWSPKGNFSVVPITAEVIYHLDLAHIQSEEATYHNNPTTYSIEGWRFQILQQSYFTPQRSLSNITSAIQLIGVQIDQIMLPWLFFSYQATGAYIGDHAGGYATGMIGPGIQTRSFANNTLQAFANVLIGAGGGGGLALSGGAIIEPQVGLRYAFTSNIGLQASVGELKALRDNLNTPVLNIGLTSRFDTLS